MLLLGLNIFKTINEMLVNAFGLTLKSLFIHFVLVFYLYNEQSTEYRGEPQKIPT